MGNIQRAVLLYEFRKAAKIAQFEGQCIVRGISNLSITPSHPIHLFLVQTLPGIAFLEWVVFSLLWMVTIGSCVTISHAFHW